MFNSVAEAGAQKLTMVSRLASNPRGSCCLGFLGARIPGVNDQTWMRQSQWLSMLEAVSLPSMRGKRGDISIMINM